MKLKIIKILLDIFLPFLLNLKLREEKAKPDFSLTVSTPIILVSTLNSLTNLLIIKNCWKSLRPKKAKSGVIIENNLTIIKETPLKCPTLSLPHNISPIFLILIDIKLSSG